MAKETYSHGKRDLPTWQKSPANAAKQTCKASRQVVISADSSLAPSLPPAPPPAPPPVPPAAPPPREAREGAALAGEGISAPPAATVRSVSLKRETALVYLPPRLHTTPRRERTRAVRVLSWAARALCSADFRCCTASLTLPCRWSSDPRLYSACPCVPRGRVRGCARE